MDFLLQGVSSHLRPYLFVVVLLNALSCDVVGGGDCRDHTGKGGSGGGSCIVGRVMVMVEVEVVMVDRDEGEGRK